MRDTPYRQLKFKDYTIEGFSRAACQTFWRLPEFHLGFDLGAMPWDFMGTPFWFISHTHLDHLAFLPNYVARRRMMKMTPPTIFLPQKFVPAVEKLLGVWAKLDNGSFPCELVGLEGGEEVELSREVVVQAHPVQHRIPALGYVVFHRRKKLKPEFLPLSGDEIRNLKESGVKIDYEIRVPKVAYLGDSNVHGLDANEIFYKAETLIMEMTFAEEEHTSDKIERKGHIHLNDIVRRKDKFENELIILSHFTFRSTFSTIQECVQKKLPDMLGGRIKLWG
ncbi:MAG: MBL fold metallo-hydrolase [Planctomycetia bacterium]|nr:MBL fold metallo-hydrolase [Planctomycetia bacterium]